MVLRKLFLLTLVFSVCSSSFLVAEEQSTPIHEVEVPDPLQLKRQWWDYFTATGEPYAEQSEKFVIHIQELLTQLEGEQKETAAVTIKRIVSQVGVLPELREEHVEQVKSKPFLDSYSLQQQIDLAKQLASQLSNLNQEKKEEKFLVNRNSKLAQHLDKLIISYRDISEDTFQKFMIGLDIINTRLTMGINEEKLRLVREKKLALENLQKRSDEELKFAQAHGDINGVNIEELEAELKQVKTDLDMARNRSLSAGLRTQTFYDNTLQGKLKGSLQQLEEYNLSIKEVAAELAVLFQEAKLLIGMVNQEGHKTSGSDLKNQYQAMSVQLNSIQNQIQQWEQRNDEEFGRFDKVVEGENEISDEIERSVQLRAKKIQENRMLLNHIEEKISTTDFVLGRLDRILASQSPAYLRLWTRTVDSVSDCCVGFIGWYDTTLFRIGDEPITPRNIFNGIVVLLIAYLSSLLLRKLVTKGFKKRHFSHGFTYSINRLIHYTVMFLGVIFALTSIGLDFDRIYIVIGALGVGIGFGLQGIVNNFVSGLIILFTRNFKVGDLISIQNGNLGSVTAINVQNTIIRTFDGVDIVIPNSSLITSQFVNWTRKDPYKRFKVRFCVAFGSDKEKVVEVVKKAAEEVPATAGKANHVSDPDCWLVEIGDYGLVFELVVWANLFKSGNHGSIGTSYVWAVESALREHGFKIPYPTRNLHIESEDK